MIRYKKKINVNTNKNGDITIHTDMGQTWKTTRVKEHNQFGEWLWAHHTTLRQYQRDFMQLIHQAFNPETGLHSIALYWVYQQGKGYQEQSADIAFARLESCNSWILMTPQNTWMIETKYESFSLDVEDSLGPVTSQETKDALWEFHDSMLGIKSKKKQYTDKDYVERGIAP